MIVYPAGLPAPLLGYTQEPENNILRTPMQSGRARQRPLYTSMPNYASLEWLFGGSCEGTTGSQQAQLFETWARSLVGAEWFEMPVRTPWGRDSVTMRFRATPQGPTHEGPNAWRYTASIEIRNPVTLPGEWAELAPDYMLFSDIFDKAMNFHWPEWVYSVQSNIFDFAMNQEWPQV